MAANPETFSAGEDESSRDEEESFHGRPSESQGDQTPEMMGTGNDSDSEVSGKLTEMNLDDEERQTEPLQDKGKQAKGVKSTVNKNEDGEWFEKHPWNEEINLEVEFERMDDEVDISAETYKVNSKWTVDGKMEKVDLKKIHSNLPEFFNEMRGKTCRQELEDVVQLDASPHANKRSDNTLRLKPIPSTENLSPHLREVVDKQKVVVSKYKPSFPAERKERFKAYSLQKTGICFLDCEYMCKVYLPGNTSDWIHANNQQIISEANPDRINQRWIFIPSRAKTALLDWPEDDIMTPENTIRILVVRPVEFVEYVMYCGHKFPIICLPNDEIGAGYSRFWIMKIALRLNLKFIWMIDDSVECFYEYHPDQPSAKESRSPNRQLKFGLVFERIEKLVKQNNLDARPIAAMSPRRGDFKSKPKKPVSCKPPQGAVFLNLRVLQERNIYYRPELKTFEDMWFGYECEQEGLKVFRDNRVILQDHN